MAAQEVTIQCLAEEVYVRDLGLRLTRGAELPVSVADAMASRDLESARARGEVVLRGARPAAVRPPPSPALPDAQLAQPLATGQLLSAAYQLLAAIHELTHELRNVRAEGFAPPSAPWSAPRTQEAATPPPDLVFEDGDDPFFIPNFTGGGFVDHSVQVAEETDTDTGSLDSTAAALRAARKNP